MSKINIVLADDHVLVRKGIKSMLESDTEIQVIGEAGNGKELLKVVEQHRPDVVITDIMMPVLDGIEACRIIHSNFGETRVIALSMFNEDNLVIDMLEAGATGYLLKNTNRAELLEAVGRPEEALQWYRSLPQLHFDAVVYQAPASRRVEAIVAAAGGEGDEPTSRR